MKIKIEVELDTDRDAHEIEQLIDIVEKIKEKAKEVIEDE
tara:strand:- start:46632 stop:46751 length:120 start_codon:yes stop_codon:yes gene_type:complete